jgi:hypothetical protein
MAEIPLINPEMADIPTRVITISIRADNINVEVPVGMPMDVTWGILQRAARAFECEMQALRVIEQINNLSVQRSIRKP